MVQAKKISEPQSSMTKSGFLYGYPNRKKFDALQKLQMLYTEAVNHYITLIDANKDLLLQVLKNDKKDGQIRQFEKANRVSYLTSAYAQNAFDEAVTILSNRADNILREVRTLHNSIFTKIHVLVFACLTDKDKNYAVSKITEIRDGYQKQPFIDRYNEILHALGEMSDEEFLRCTNEVKTLYQFTADSFKLPKLKKVYVKADTRLCKLEKSQNIATDFVLSITLPFTKGQRLEIPLSTSSNTVRRFEEYGAAGTVFFTLQNKGKMKVSCSFDKKVKLTDKPDDIVGVDVGITDMLHTSNGTRFGTFADSIAYYTNDVEPKLGDLSTLRNKKRTLLTYLRKHKNLPDPVKTDIRNKIDHLEQMIRGNKVAKKRLNRYHNEQVHAINQATDAYIDSLCGNKSTLTVLELLDIKEFNKSKQSNQRLSTFVRGLLSEKLMDKLNWHGYRYAQIEPAYTSQVCPHCHHLDKANRNGKVFQCIHCGFTDDADHIGSINIKNRYSDTEIQDICASYPYNKKERTQSIKSLYSKRHDAFIKAHPQTIPA